MSKKEITNVKDAIAFVKKAEAKLIDLKFTDFFGKWQHVTIPAHRVDEALFEEGLGFDGSSLRGWQPINLTVQLVERAAVNACANSRHLPYITKVCMHACLISCPQRAKTSGVIPHMR